VSGEDYLGVGGGGGGEGVEEEVGCCGALGVGVLGGDCGEVHQLGHLVVVDAYHRHLARYCEDGAAESPEGFRNSHPAFPGSGDGGNYPEATSRA
jgi:hypothetical protein